jgi:hypothetical protein
MTEAERAAYATARVRELRVECALPVDECILIVALEMQQLLGQLRLAIEGRPALVNEDDGCAGA